MIAIMVHKMKMTIEHYSKLDKALNEYLDTTTDLQGLIRAYQANPRYKDWRIAFMWAIYHTVKPLTTDETKGYLDAHIETALKKAIGRYIYP